MSARRPAPERVLCAFLLALAVSPACSRQATTGLTDASAPETSDRLSGVGTRDGAGRVDGPVENRAIADTVELHEPDVQPEIPEAKADPDLPILLDIHEIEVFIDPCEGVDCDDGNQCTDDDCNAGDCVHTAHAGPCEDGDGCTSLDLCAGGVCVSGAKVTCDDGNPCTIDVCNPYNDWDAALCLHASADGAPCDDGAPDTTDVCYAGKCVGCLPDCSCKKCGDDGCGGSCGDCDDGNDCTVDSCEFGKCWHEVAETPGCCGYHSDCVDGDPCTYDQCLDHVCHNEEVLYQCCHDDAYCGEPGPCGTPKCNLIYHTCEFEFKSIEEQKSQGLECCEKSEDCTAGGIWEEDTDGDGAPGPDDVATLDYCLDRQCIHFSLPDECDCGPGQPCVPDADPKTLDYCLDGCACVHPPDPLFCDSPADCKQDGIAFTDEGCVDNHCLYELNFGPHCDVLGIGCHDDDPCTVGVCSVQYSSILHPMSCEFDQIPGCCEADDDCDDCNPCTFDHCIASMCYHASVSDPPEGCCSYAFPCDDGDPCTLDECVDLVCKHTPSANCCDTDAECDDDNSCTADLCSDGYCQHVQLGEGCCAVQPDCDDGNPCTDDFCSNLPVDFGSCFSMPDNTNQCDDGDPKTINVCGNGVCVVLFP